MFFIVKRWNYHPHNRMRNLHVGFEQHPKHTIYSGGIVLCLSKPSLKDNFRASCVAKTIWIVGN